MSTDTHQLHFKLKTAVEYILPKVKDFFNIAKDQTVKFSYAFMSWCGKMSAIAQNFTERKMAEHILKKYCTSEDWTAYKNLLPKCYITGDSQERSGNKALFSILWVGMRINNQYTWSESDKRITAVAKENS